MLNINYYFGTGGFYALWIVLLGTDLKCIFNDKRSLEEIYKDHWNILEIDTWKKTEIWPINHVDSDVQFFCNPDSDTWENQCTGKRVVIYTDVQTHFKLAQAKRAGPWVKNIWEHKILNTILKPYNDIKADHWPEVTTFEQLLSLEDYQKQELESITPLKICDNLFETFAHVSSVEWNNQRIYYDYKNVIDIDHADICCNLLDIVKTNGDCLLKPLGYSTNEKCIDFTNYYKKLNKDLI